MTPKEFEDRQKRIIRERCERAFVLSALRRAKEAGIPEDLQRINKNEFKSLLCPKYKNTSGTIDSISNMIFDKPEDIYTKYQFILIDGGGRDERRRAGFAILFRLIALEIDHDQMSGKYSTGDNFIHRLENASYDGEQNRIEFSNEMSAYNSIFISEFDSLKVNPKRDAGTFFDEIMEKRENKKRPTIISFSRPISEVNELKDNVAGLYFYDFSRCEKSKPMRNALRIRVKITQDNSVNSRYNSSDEDF